MTRPDEPERSLSQRTLVGTLWMVLWRCVTRGLGLVSTLVLARMLSPADFGLVAMAMAFAAGVEALSELRLQEALIRQPETPRDLLDTAFTLQVLSCGLTAGLLAVTSPLAAAWFEEPRLTLLMLVMAAAALVAGFENIGAVEFRRRLQGREQVVLLLVPRLVQLGVALGAAVALRSFWALPMALVALRTARVVMTYVRHPYRPRLSLRRWRDFVGFSGWSWATGLVRVVWDRVDVFVLGPVLGSRQLGIYLLGREVASLPVTDVVEPATGVVYSAISAAQHRGRRPVEMVPEVVAVLLVATLPIAIAISAAASAVTAVLLGGQWAEAVPVIAILALGAMVAPCSLVCTSALEASGAVRRDFLAICMATALRCVLIVLASFSGEIVIVAWAGVAAAIAEMVALLTQVRREGTAGFGRMAGSYARLAVASAATSAVLWASGLGWAPGMPKLAAAVLGGALTAVVAVLVFGAVLLAAWWACGRPSGVESRIIGLAVAALAPSDGARGAPAGHALRRLLRR